MKIQNVQWGIIQIVNTTRDVLIYERMLYKSGVSLRNWKKIVGAISTPPEYVFAHAAVKVIFVKPRGRLDVSITA